MYLHFYIRKSDTRIPLLPIYGEKVRRFFYLRTKARSIDVALSHYLGVGMHTTHVLVRTLWENRSLHRYACLWLPWQMLFYLLSVVILKGSKVTNATYRTVMYGRQLFKLMINKQSWHYIYISPKEAGILVVNLSLEVTRNMWKAIISVLFLWSILG